MAPPAAAPPVLGWAAITGEVTADALILFLIIFVWTPPHFWALALYRRKEYARVGIPMLPVTHGEKFTRLHILLYTILLFAVTLMPFATRMSGWLYLIGTIPLNAVFLYYAWQLHRRYSDELARRTFRYSIQYLALLFTLLLVDHYRLYIREALQSAPVLTDCAQRASASLPLPRRGNEVRDHASTTGTIPMKSILHLLFIASLTLLSACGPFVQGRFSRQRHQARRVGRRFFADRAQRPDFEYRETARPGAGDLLRLHALPGHLRADTGQAGHGHGPPRGRRPRTCRCCS